ncbi:MrcB family domain-containing protein [Vibrio cholerae]
MLVDKLTRFINGWVQAANEQFTGHPLAKLFRQELKEDIGNVVKENYPSFEVKASVGAGNWANVPWLSILNPLITTTTQDGIYPVYLFNADGSGVYLSLNQGTTIPIQKYGKKAAEKRAEKIRRVLLNHFPELKEWGTPNIDLKATTSLGKSYEPSNIAAKFYDSSVMPSNDVLHHDLLQLLSIYKSIESCDIEALLKSEDGSSYLVRSKQDMPKIRLPKPFLLLAGISGTGKTRFVRKQAEARGQLSSTYCLTSVRPDWHEPSDLLGYVSRLGGHAEYITTDVLTFMAQAWRAIADNENLNIECVDSDGQGKRLVVSGEAEALEDVPPYWLCLDEMNLAPVEQYFADYLSVLETREWCWDSSDSFRYSCDALLKPSFLQLNGENGVEQAYNTKLRESLKLADSKYDDLWHCFCEYGLPIPFNLIVAGTVNMDETTHGFSRKVIDRAMSFDFGEFFPNEIDEFFEGDQKKSANTLSYPILSHVRKIEEFSAVEADSDASKTKEFFKAINNVLKNTPFELAFRAFNELCLSVICFAPKTDTELAAVFDDYLMCKVLPRIEGDEDKVRTSQGHNLLEQLTEVFQEQLTTILPNHESISRPDLLRHFEGETAEKVEVEWRSEKKLKAMTALLNNGFCSFWP